LEAVQGNGVASRDARAQGPGAGRGLRLRARRGVSAARRKFSRTERRSGGCMARTQRAWRTWKVRERARTPSGAVRTTRMRRNLWRAALVRISAKADYAVRAAVELAAAGDDRPVKAERIATAQGIPLNFLENILSELRHAGIVR